LADWLAQCGIHSVAMESTSVYWIPVYQILEARGLEVYLVNAQHVKNVPGRKTDVSDCQWLQYLHSGWPSPRQFSATWIHLRHTISLETPRQPDSDGS
jgi:hypothetical protein